MLYPLRESRAHFTLLALMLLHGVIVMVLVWARIYGFRAGGDSAMFDQVFWNMLQTGVPLSTNAAPPYAAMNWFAWHFSPVFYLLLPFYGLYPSAITLSLLQSVLMASTAIPVYAASRTLTLSPHYSILFAALTLFNPFFFNAALWDFHEIAIACPAMAVAMWSVLARQKCWLLVAALILLMTKEHYGLSVAGLGIWWAIYHREWRFGGLLCSVGLMALLLVLLVVMPYFQNAGLSYMLQPVEADSLLDSARRYNWLRGTPSQVFANMTHLLFGTMPNGNNGLSYIILLLVGWLFLPLGTIFALLPAASDLAANLLSMNFMPRYVTAYHSAPIIPVLAITAAIATARLHQRGLMRRIFYPACLIACGAVMFLAYNSIRVWEIHSGEEYVADGDIAAIRQLAGDKIVVAQSNIALFFSQRREIYLFPRHAEQAQMLIFYLRHPYRQLDTNPFAANYVDRTEVHFSRVREWLEKGNYGVTYWKNNWLVLERGAEIDEGVKREITSRIDTLLAGNSP